MSMGTLWVVVNSKYSSISPLLITTNMLPKFSDGCNPLYEWQARTQNETVALSPAAPLTLNLRNDYTL
jgi:hypothetical protein